jgi:hypothetical protein
VIAPTPALLNTNVVAVVLVVPPVVLLMTLNVYGAVPAEAVNVPPPLVSPAQVSATLPVLFSNNAGGCVIVIVDWVVHPFASVTPTVIAPAPALAKTNVVAVVLVVPPVVFDITLNVKGAVPPPAVKVPAPSVSPLQPKRTLPVLFNVSAAGCVIVIVDCVLHPFASVTSTVIAPAPPLARTNVVAVVLVVPVVVLESTAKV